MFKRIVLATLTTICACACASFDPTGADDTGADDTATAAQAYTSRVSLGTSYTYANGSPMGYYKCADEGTGHQCPGVGNKHAAYGANGKYRFGYMQVEVTTGEFQGTFPQDCVTANFGGVDPVPGVGKACYYSVYDWATSEGGPGSGSMFTLTSKHPVAFGIDNSYVYKTLNAGTYYCNRDTFGGADPAVGRRKACFIGIPEYTYKMDESRDNYLTGLSNTSVAFGANGFFTFKILSGTASCDRRTFEDPIPGVGKACYILDMQNGMVADEPNSFSYSVPSGKVARTLFGSGLNDAFLSKIGTAGASGTCSRDYFGGDPSPTDGKHCWGGYR